METQKRDNKQAKGVSTEGGVERMITPSIQRHFDLVLKAERLAEIPPRFHDPSFFDEVPLYSRYSQVDFLKQHGNVDLLLLELSLHYLQRVASESPRTRSKRLLAVTIIRDDVNESIVPYIFICNNNVKSQLRSLQLSSPSDGLGKHIQGLMDRLATSADYRVLEDRSTVPGDVRVFISYNSPQNSLMGLEAFMNSARERNSRR
jgi:hypothetical protein